MAAGLPPSISIEELLPQLTQSQRQWLGRIGCQFLRPITRNPNPTSDIATSEWVEHFGNLLLAHHAMSDEDLKKERFEFGFVLANVLSGRKAEKAANTNPGHDVTLDKTIRISLKTQSDAGIKPAILHISKFMELGSGDWVYASLLQQFLNHLAEYDRILVLRSLLPGPANKTKRYELVEIPRSLFLSAAAGVLSERNPTRPLQTGYCWVPSRPVSRRKADRMALTYQLKFDGEGERKLSVESLRKTSCFVHATWEFTIP